MAKGKKPKDSLKLQNKPDEMHNDPYKLFLTRFKDFTEIQVAAIPKIEAGENCIITAPTGSGKTEAAILPTLKKILCSDNKAGIMALYITPLRSLNRDLMKRLSWLGSELAISISTRHGDTPQSERRRQSTNPPQLLITTPETIQNLLLSKNLRKSLSNIKTVIVDEIHELYYNKRGAQLSVALERLEELSIGYQRIGISATIGNIGDAAKFLFNERNYSTISSKTKKDINITIELPMAPENENRNLRQLLGLDVRSYSRVMRVATLINNSKASLVFANTRQAVESIGSKLIIIGKSFDFGKIGIHHSSIDREERISTENAFKEGKIKAILATSSLELGIDIGAVDLVIQYGSPKQVTRLIQRVGRAGHSESKTTSGQIIATSELDALESIAISEAALSFKLEKREVEKNALDVLANQIIAMALEYRKISRDSAFKIIKKTYAYSSLKQENFDKVCTLISDLRLINDDNSTISLGPRGRKYFINKISVIPDNSKFIVKVAADNKAISSLDEEFVSNYIDAGSVFITKGFPWKAISIEDGTIYVEPSDDITAAVPDWEGEDIPVSLEIASKVYDYLKIGIPNTQPKIDTNTQDALEKFIQKNKEFISIDKNTITIEELDSCAIAYMPYGKNANDFIAKILSTTASSVAGTKINVKATPYALIFDYTGLTRLPDTEKILNELKVININDIHIIYDSDLFRYKFIQAAKLFGVIDKSAPITRSMANRLLSFYENSPISDETIRDLNKNYFEMGIIGPIINKIRTGEIRIIKANKSPSPLSTAILQSTFSFGELISAAQRASLIENMFDKFEGKSERMICTFCGHIFNEKIHVKEDKKILCQSCKSPLVAIYSDEYNKILIKTQNHKRLTTNESKIHKEILRQASFIDAYGYRAIIALSVYGIGLDTAARTLRYLRSDYKMFFTDIIDAQRNFIKNRKYWKFD